MWRAWAGPIIVFLFLFRLGPDPAGAVEKPSLPFKEQGTLEGVRYEIIIPKGWNGGLVVYAHGRHDPADGEYRFDQWPSDTGHVEAAAEHGFAVARSAFSLPGVNWIEGTNESAALRDYFAKRFGLKGRVLMTGNHGGGFICHFVLERYPEKFDGGLCMSGIGGPFLPFYAAEAFDRRVLFDYFFPGLPGSATNPPEGQRGLDLEEIKKLMLAAPPEKVTAYLRMVDRWDIESAARALRSASANLHDIIVKRLGGRNPFDTRNIIYFGSDDDARLNRDIPRYAADAEAQAYMRAWSMTGELTRPMVAMNPLKDQAVSTARRRTYLELLQQADAEGNFVQLWIDMTGVQIPKPIFAKALGLLDAWVKTGQKPAGGEISAP